MSWNPILVGVDDSPESVIAVETGIRYAKAMDVACSLAHAARDIAPIPGTTPGTVDTGRMAEEVVALARRQVTARLKSHVPEPLLASMEVRVGRASRVLADVAADRRAGLNVEETREKFSNEFTISLARNVCRAIFSSSGAFCSSPEICLASICA